MRILVAEDDRDVRELVVNILESAGHEVCAAANGAEAIAILRGSSGGAAGFDLLFTDIAMPEMDGYELARQAVAVHPDLPILYTSGYASLPGDDRPRVPAPLLHKPFRPKTLLNAVARCRRGAGKSS